MPPVIPFGPVMVVMGVLIAINEARAYFDHLASPVVELDLGAHPLYMHVLRFAFGVLLTLGGIWKAVDEHRERKEEREEDRMWEERYERTRPRGDGFR